MTRGQAGHLLILVAYLVGQAGIVFHALESGDPCQDCAGARWVASCSSDDCRQPAHHHHDGHQHHPTACRACSTQLDFLPLGHAGDVMAALSTALPIADLAALAVESAQFNGSPRAPPADLL